MSPRTDRTARSSWLEAGTTWLYTHRRRKYIWILVVATAELARGLHPSVLTTDGLGAAIEQLASRSSLPVALDVTEARFPEAVALANVAKYAQATEAEIRIEQQDGLVRLQISDNGVGGADPKAGSGLTGLGDRFAALDGTLAVDRPAGAGTIVTVGVPLAGEAPA